MLNTYDTATTWYETATRVWLCIKCGKRIPVGYWHKAGPMQWDRVCPKCTTPECITHN